MAYPFCLSYSGGKDSTLALHRLIRSGNRPVALIVTVNDNVARSWFHGIGMTLLGQVSQSLGIPLLTAACGGEDYNEAFERSLRQAKELGAEACAFGDIDIEDHRTWGRERCAAAKLRAVFPLWQEDRAAIVEEFLDAGYGAVIKAVSKAHGLPASLLGRRLDAACVEEIAALGADPCGENGEYHTFVYDGPVYSHPVAYVERGVFESEYAWSLVIEAASDPATEPQSEAASDPA